MLRISIVTLLLFLACEKNWPRPPLAKGSSGLPARWSSVPIPLCVPEPPADLGVSYGEFAALVQNGARAWGLERRLSVTPCALRVETGEDGTNTLSFVRGANGTQEDPYGRTVLYTRRHPRNSSTDEIIEADIELYVSAIRAGRERFGPALLENVVLHELGHVWGLAHACSFLSVGIRDPQVPDCAELARSRHRPLMFPMPVADSTGLLVTRPTSRERDAVLSLYGVRAEAEE